MIASILYKSALATHQRSAASTEAPGESNIFNAIIFAPGATPLNWLSEDAIIPAPSHVETSEEEDPSQADSVKDK